MSSIKIISKVSSLAFYGVAKPYNSRVDFEWDNKKATSNEAKHEVTFEEAKTVFANPLAVIFGDEVNSDDEDREIIVGHSEKNRVLLVSFTERGSRIRIISARRATHFERKEYEDHAFRER